MTWAWCGQVGAFLMDWELGNLRRVREVVRTVDVAVGDEEVFRGQRVRYASEVQKADKANP